MAGINLFFILNLLINGNIPKYFDTSLDHLPWDVDRFFTSLMQSFYITICYQNINRILFRNVYRHNNTS